MGTYNIVGYTYRADIYCPEHVVPAMTATEDYEGWDISDGYWPSPHPEDNLAEIAAHFGIDRLDEQSYDSAEFPKVIFADSVEDDSETCATCGEPLID